MFNKIKNFITNEDGAGIVEYVMIAAIAIAAVLAVTNLVMPALTQKGEDMKDQIENAGN